MQDSYNRKSGIAFAGMLADNRVKFIESPVAEGAAGFGYGLVNGTDTKNQCRVARLYKSVLSIDADLITANSTIATVNGNSTSAVVFATDHATTMAALAAAIAALDGVLSATYSGSGRDITILGDKVAVTASAVTTAGSTQGTWTQVRSNPSSFRGFAVHEPREPSAVAANDAQYKDKETVACLRQGAIWVPCVNAVTPAFGDTAYINLAIEGETGKVTNVSTSNLATGGKIRDYNSTLKIAKVVINLP